MKRISIRHYEATNFYHDLYKIAADIVSRCGLIESKAGLIKEIAQAAKKGSEQEKEAIIGAYSSEGARLTFSEALYYFAQDVASSCDLEDVGTKANAKKAIKALKAIGDGVRFGDVRIARYESLGDTRNELTLIAKGGATRKDLADVEKAIKFIRFDLCKVDETNDLWAIMGETESGAKFETVDPAKDFIEVYGPNDEPLEVRARITVTR